MCVCVCVCVCVRARAHTHVILTIMEFHCRPRRSSFPASASPSTTSARPGWVEEDWRDEEDEEEEEEEEEVGESYVLTTVYQVLNMFLSQGSLATSSTHSDPCSVAGPQVYQCEGGGYRVDPSTVSSSPIR